MADHGGEQVPAVCDPMLSWAAKGAYMAIAWLDAAAKTGAVTPPVHLGMWSSSSDQETELACQELEMWGYLVRHPGGHFDLHWAPHPPGAAVQVRDSADADERTMHAVNRLGRRVSVEQVEMLCMATGLTWEQQHEALLRLETAGRLLLSQGWWRPVGG